MMTGQDQEEALIQYHTRESKRQKEQRVKITSSKTQFASGKVAKYFNEVHRSDTIIDQLFYIDDADNKKRDRLRDALTKFSHGSTMKEWLDDEYHYRQFYDPNSVLITEWILDDQGVPQPYPLNVDAKDVLDFKVVHGKFDHVTIRQAKWYKKKGNDSDYSAILKNYTEGQQEAKKSGNVKMKEEQISGWEMAWKYTTYGIGQTIEMIQIPSGDAIFDPDEYPDFTLEQFETQEKVESFMVRELEQNIDFCPVLRWGYFKDPETKGRTFVSPLYPAEKLFTDLIRNKSEYDVTKALHGFYQKFVYVQKCSKCNGTGEVINPKNQALSPCKPCEGKGKLYQQSSQDIVAITLPDKPDGNNVFDLSKLVHFAEIPSYIATMQKEDVKDAVKDIFSAIFNEMLFEQPQTELTATQSKLNLRSMYNALHPYTDHLARMYKTEIQYVHSVLEIQGTLVNNFAITKDYNMESLGDLFLQRQTAVGSGAPQAIIDQIDAKILKKQHQNDPEFLDQYEAIQALKPLRDKTPSEVMAVMSRQDPSSLLTVQWTYFADIVEAMKAENPNVFKLPYESRKLAFDAMSKQFQVLNVEPTTSPTIF